MTIRRLGALCALFLVSATFLAGCSSSPMEPEARTIVDGKQVTLQADVTNSKYCAAED